MYIYKGQYPRYPNSPSAEPSNSFVCLPLPSYVFLKNLSELQFIRMLSKSFVYLPLLSYVFLKNFSDLQFIRMSSTSFICLPKKNLNSNLFVCCPSLSYVFHFSYVFLKNLSELQFIRMSSKSFVCLLIHSYVFQKQILHPNSFVCLPLP